MTRINHTLSGVRIFVFVFAVAFSLIFWATAAHAQQSADVQYAKLAAPSGPAAGAMCSTIESTDGLLNAGDFVVFEGNFSIAPGASVVVEDQDGTQGTLIDGENAEISEDSEGGIEVSVTGNPVNVVGGDGVLSDAVCGSIVTTTGVAAAQAAPDEDSAAGVALSVLPDTGGSLIVLLSGLALTGTGLAVFRHARRR